MKYAYSTMIINKQTSINFLEIILVFTSRLLAYVYWMLAVWRNGNVAGSIDKVILR